MNIVPSEITVNARDLQLRDLDFPECSNKLKEHINSIISESTTSIILDLRWCVVIYSQACLFFDACFQFLASKKESEGTSKLIILTTDSYTTKELMCYELLRTSMAAKESDKTPLLVVQSMNEFCSRYKIQIEIQVFCGDLPDGEEKRLQSYIFGATIK